MLRLLPLILIISCAQPKVVVVQKGTVPTQAQLRTQSDLQHDSTWKKLMGELK